jgi:hypothetical protein
MVSTDDDSEMEDAGTPPLRLLQGRSSYDNGTSNNAMEWLVGSLAGSIHVASLIPTTRDQFASTSR